MLENETTEPAPHGMFRDWPNAKPFMGTVDEIGFDLLEKMKFGQGWPAMTSGTFTKRLNVTVVSLVTYPKPIEMSMLLAMYLLAPIFILIGLFANGTPSDPMTILERVMVISVPVFMITMSLCDYNERANRVEQKLTKLFRGRP